MVPTFNPLSIPSFNPLAIPDTNCIAYELYPFPNWIIWKDVDGKKKPCCADRYCRRYDFDGAKLSYLDAAHQRFFNVASKYLVNHRQSFKGLGFVLRLPYAQNCAYTCIDIDWKHNNPPLPTPFQQSVIDACIGRTYIEYSPSSLGVHIWFRGSFGSTRKRAEIEVYSHSRFMAVTFKPLLDINGNAIGNVPFADWEPSLPMFPHELLTILATSKVPPSLSAIKASASSSMPTGGGDDAWGSDFEWLKYPPDPLTQDDCELCARIAKGRNGNGELFTRLFMGDKSRYNDDWSVADLVFLNILAYYTDDVEQLLRIFHNSALGRRDKAYRPDYLQRTIKKAFDRRLPTISLTPINGIVGGE
jgi:putative DNA primase/helicase